MGEGAGVCNCIFQIIQLGISIAIIVLIVQIYNKTEENPLEKYEKEHPITGNNGVANYIKKVDYVSSLARFKYCQCGEEILNNICTEEQIISGCFDVSKSSDRLLLRNLEDMNCKDLSTEILNKGGFSKVFDLGFDMVHKMALGLMIVLIAVGASIVLTVIAEIGKICCGEGAALIIAPCAICIICVVLFAGLTNFVLFIILMVNYYKGTTTGEFLDYYNTCLTADEKKSLESTFNELDGLDSTMTAFVALNFIGMGLNCIASCLGFANKENKD